MLRLLVLVAVLVAGQVAAQETCTELVVTGDEVDASCTCTCTCDVDCPLTTTPEEVITTTTEPPRLPCTAGWDGKNVVTTYDGNTYDLETNNKFLFTQFDASSDDDCKFQVRVDTEDAPDGSGPQVGWVGVGFGVHLKNSAKFERNFRVSLTQGVVEVRGRGYDPIPAEDNTEYGAFPLWSFSLETTAPGSYKIMGLVPSRGCWFSVLYEEQEATGLTNDRVTVDASENYDGQLKGICGNRDGDATNDDLFCPISTGNVSGDCIDGEHQFNG